MGAAERRRRRAVVALAAVLLACALLPASGWATAFQRGIVYNDNNGGATTLAVTVPAATQAGDLMIATVTPAGGGAITPPAGWTTLIAQANAAVGYSATYWKEAVAADETDSTSYTWNFGTSRAAAAGIAAYGGVDTASPTPIASFSTGGNVNSTSPSAGSVTTTAANTFVVAGYQLQTSNSPLVTHFAGADIPDVSPTFSTSTPKQGVYVNGFVQAAAGATGAKTITLSSASNYAASQLVLRSAAGTLAFESVPDLPALPALALNGRAQTATATMPSFSVADSTGSGAGWNVTVAGDGSAGKSAVFKQYCPNASCGSDPAGYVAGGRTLPANSLKLTSTGASFTSGGGGTAPTLSCAAGCSVDAASPVEVASAAVNAGAGSWTASGFGASSLTLSTPSTLRTLPAAEVYRADVVWTLSSGP